MRGPLNCRGALVLLTLALVMAGCGADDSAPGPRDTGTATCAPGELLLEGGGCQPAGLPQDMPCPPGEMPLEGGGCQPAGLPQDMPCPPGEMPLEGGGCQAAGVPPDACGQGFEPDRRGGCDPILPEAPCQPGQMAIPGDRQCRKVASCGVGDYGLIPVDAETQFVNGAYAGDDSDGTRARPWKHIQEGIDHARSGAIVAVAAGKYNEDLLIRPRPVRLWGRCPSAVEVVGTGAQNATIEILGRRASGSAVHSLAITGPGIGIGTTGASDVVVDRVWIHDTTSWGLDAVSELGRVGLTVSASLIEATKDLGMNITGSDATIESTVVRGVRASSTGEIARGINIDGSRAGQGRSTVTLRASLLERNDDLGVLVFGSDATIESTVVRTTRSRSGIPGGTGIQIQPDPATQERATLALRASLLEGNHGVGVAMAGSEATIESTVVRDTQPRSDRELGRGIHVQGDHATKARGKLTLRASLLERNHDNGVVITGAEATIEATLVRDTLPDDNETYGRGIHVEGDPTTKARGTLALRASLVEQNHEAGVYVEGSDATIEASVVRDTQPRGDRRHGSGVVAVASPAGTRERGTVTLRASLVEQNHEAGVFVEESDATIEASVVRDTEPRSNGTGGFGIVAQDGATTHQRATLALRGALLEQNREIGVLVVNSDVTIDASVVRDTQPRRNGFWGRGINIEHDPATRQRATLTLRGSRVEHNHELGVGVFASDATIEASVVRDTQPRGDGRGGEGIRAQHDTDTQERSTLALRASLVEQNHEAGVVVFDSDATVEATVVRATRPRRDETAGDGIAVVSSGAPAAVTVTSTQIESNARAGIASFSAAVLLVSSLVKCNRIDLDGEDTVEGKPFTFDGSKGNLCGCDNPDATCPVLSAELSPPASISPVRPEEP
ncbi:right-handed parallel beta-helix repeat-containing protein [Sorangium sp. So ce1389]|uniref:right-handed parallel beta-helix repeat-containing protein n=1 Tax=Sorangium sp. So ce1389 TaxID=3133336 RepID=UPI003F6284EF